ncbi:hypothetical protein OAA60_00790 [Porticoccaceae bacterium]|nr:hypothetical protein [Porticoccaceae bacterium]
MTTEGLHRKSEIVAELAWRDMKIAELEAENPLHLTKADMDRAIWVAPNGEYTSLPPSIWKPEWFVKTAPLDVIPPRGESD